MQRRADIVYQQELCLNHRTLWLVSATRRAACWSAQHWLALANGAFLLAVVGAVSVPLLRTAGLGPIADGLFGLYHLVCHQLPERSFYILGHPMAFCQRDTAIYGSIACSGILYASVRRWLAPLPWRWYMLSLVPIGIDGATQLIGLRESSWELRLLTGTIFGIATAWLAYPHLELFATAILAQEGEPSLPIREVTE